MKTKNIIIFGLIAALLTLSGCQSATNFVTDLLYDETEVMVIDPETNAPLTTTVTVVSNEGQKETIVVPVTETVYEPKSITRMVVGASGAAPIPYLETILGVALAGFAGYAKKQNTKLQKSEDANKTLEAITAASISGIEAFSKTDEGKAVSKKLKTTIKDISTYIGYDREMADKVNRVVNSGKNA